MSSPYSYAQLPVFKYQTFDRNSVQFTNIPVWKPSTPPPVEKEPEPEIVPPEAPEDQAEEEPVGDDQAGDNAGKEFQVSMYLEKVILTTELQMEESIYSLSKRLMPRRCQ